MKIEFALRDEKVNIFAMTHGGINSKMTHQIMLCKKQPFKENRKGPFILDTKKSSANFQLSTIGKTYLDKKEKQKYRLKFIAFVDDQIKININEEVFYKLCNKGFFQIWNLEGPMKYFSSKSEGYIILFRVYELEEEIDEKLLEKGRSGRNYYYALTEKVDYKLKKPVLSDKEYLDIKNKLKKIIKESDNNTGNYIYTENNEIFENNIGRDKESYLYKIDIVDVNESYKEGNEKISIHKSRERNIRVIDRAKILFKQKNNNMLFCEICGFDFEKTYGEIGIDFIEGHHNIPVSQMKENDETKVEDIIMVCANCHRMLHRKNPWITVENLKKIYLKNK